MTGGQVNLKENKIKIFQQKPTNNSVIYLIDDWIFWIFFYLLDGLVVDRRQKNSKNILVKIIIISHMWIIISSLNFSSLISCSQHDQDWIFFLFKVKKTKKQKKWSTTNHQMSKKKIKCEKNENILDLLSHTHIRDHASMDHNHNDNFLGPLIIQIFFSSKNNNNFF